jgi:cytochrome c oxidase subunit 3
MSTAVAVTGRKYWAGGKSPFDVSYGKLMMWYFLMSDALTFGAFLISYGTIRFSSQSWPDPNKVFESFPLMGHTSMPLVFVSLMTFILIFSSVTMVLAVQAGHRMERKKVMYYMFLTILGGLAFLGCQAWEWTHLNHQGAWWGITGFHGFHVFSGVIINIIMLIMTSKGVFDRRGHYEMIEKAGLYWHFVDLVWVFVFTCFYLL